MKKYQYSTNYHENTKNMFFENAFYMYLFNCYNKLRISCLLNKKEELRAKPSVAFFSKFSKLFIKVFSFTFHINY